MTSVIDASSQRRRLWWWSALVLVACAFVLWLIHPLLLSKALRIALDQAAADAGLQLEIGNIEAHLTKPIVFEGVKVRARDAEESRTAADIARVETSLNWSWSVFFGQGRLFRAIMVDDVRAVIDLRSRHAGQTKEVVVLSGIQQSEETKRTLRWLPEYMEIHHGNLEFVARNQSYYFEDVFAYFSEDRVGTFEATGAELRAGSFRESVGALKGITAWKEGILHLASLDLWKGVRIESLAVQLARPGGVAIGLEATLYGGSLRIDISFDSGSPGVVDCAIWGSQLDVAPLVALFGFAANAEGIIREAKFTFRGLSDRALDGQASLRLAADGFRWNKRGWESLEVGASMIHRRLAVSNFELKQKENILTGSGEFSLDQGWLGIANAPFALNVSASIKDLAALAGLLGPPFDEMTGRMTLGGLINGEAGKLQGFVSLEASGMTFRKHPVNSGRLDVRFSNSEAQINRCDFWSGEDFLRATGTLDLRSPHHYSGEIRAQTKDLAKYRDFYHGKIFPNIRAGAARLRWQGDGTLAAHSGAFNLTVDDLVSAYTPSGLTGRFAGTYSPENVYFSGFELEHDDLRFSTRATLARSGIALVDAVLRSGPRQIAEAEVYFPFDPFEAISARSLEKAIDLNKNLYASIASQAPLNVRELLCLIGKDGPLDGTVELDLRLGGVPSALSLDGTIQGRGLMRRFQHGSSPPTQFNATLKAIEGAASFTGQLASPGLPPLSLKAEGPFGIVKGPAGRLHWINPEGKFAVSLEIPQVDLAIVRPLFPTIERVAGFLSGSLAFSGTVAKPQLAGQLMIRDAQLELSPNAPVIGNVNAAVIFNAGHATVEEFVGKIGEGSFEVRGGASLENLTDPYCELFFYGNKIDLARVPGLQLKANVNLYASGDSAGGMVKGAIHLVDGRLSRRLEITPLLVAPPSEENAFLLIEFPVSTFFKNWKVDVSIDNETPFLFAGNAPSGEIIPELQLKGTVANPLPLGKVQLKNTRVFLPFTTMTIPEGYLHFVEDSPGIPLLDVRGTAQALDYEVQAYAFGPLSERRLILRSEPPLSQDLLIHLLTTGMAPSIYAGTASAEPQRTAGLDPVRDFSKNLAPPGVGNGSSTGFLPSSNIPPRSTGARATLRSRFELWRGLSLMNESDVFGLSQGPAYFNVRLR